MYKLDCVPRLQPSTDNQQSSYLYLWRPSPAVFLWFDAAATGLYFSYCDYSQSGLKAEGFHSPVRASDEIRAASPPPPSSGGKMKFLFMFCGLANFLIKVHDSAADSPCYLWSRPLAACSEREKLPRRENSGHFDVTLSSFKRWKGQRCTSRRFLWLQPQIAR